MDDNSAQSRRLLFISHANPADNDFTVWLGGRLSAMGYTVWADLRDLKGGSRHWKEIEEKIRRDASKVLVVTSRASRQAEGVENEINIAKGIEKELSLENFIIQLKIDDLPYTQLPPTLNNRLVISFEQSWSTGLGVLVKQLEEENSPREETGPSSAGLFATVLREGADTVANVDEPVFASWIPYNAPSTLHVYTFPGLAKTMETRLLAAGIPAYSFSNTLISFAIPDAIAYGIGESVHDINHVEATTEAWLENNSLTEFAIMKRDRRRAFNGLINAAWNSGLRQAGFIELSLSSEKAFFLPSQNREPIKQRYTDPLGRKTGPITLVGESKKREALWHAAISARASLSPLPIFSVRLHVAFTKDGFTPMADGMKAFRLRRTFCKSFWNDRWRRIYFSLLSCLSSGGTEILLPTGGEEPIRVGTPLSLKCPYSIATDLAMQIDENEVEDEVEEFDDDFFEPDLEDIVEDMDDES